MSGKKVKGYLQHIRENKKKRPDHPTIKPYIKKEVPKFNGPKIKDPKIQKMLEGIRNAKDLTGNKKK